MIGKRHKSNEYERFTFYVEDARHCRNCYHFTWLMFNTVNLLLLLQFYYSDINLSRDKFLQEQIKLDDGCILFAQ